MFVISDRVATTEQPLMTTEVEDAHDVADRVAETAWQKEEQDIVCIDQVVSP